MLSNTYRQFDAPLAAQASVAKSFRRDQPVPQRFKRSAAVVAAFGVFAQTVAFLAVVAGVVIVDPQVAAAHSVGQVDMSVNLAPDTQQLLIDRAAGSTPGFQIGDVVESIIRFAPVPNGANTGPNGWVTFYVPPNTEVVGASFVEPDGAGGFYAVSPDAPAAIEDGFGTKANASFNNVTVPAGVGEPAGTAPFSSYAPGSVGQVYGDVGIFFSTDPRTSKYVGTTVNDGTNPDDQIATVNNGYLVTPTGCGQLLPIVGATACKTHNVWDANMTNSFGSSGVPAYSNATGATPAGYSSIGIAAGRGNTPHLVGSPVAGPQTLYGRDYTGRTGPWQRVAYGGSYIGSNVKYAPGTPNAAGDATDTSGWRVLDPVADAAIYGRNLTEASPLPANTNAIRFAVGSLVVGEVEHVQVDLRILSGYGGECFILDSEVFGGDAAGVDGGKDNPWRYHEPVPSPGNGCLAFQKDGPNVADKSAGPVDYVIRFLNGSNAPMTGVSIVDDLPSGGSYVSGSTTIKIDGTTYSTANPTIAGQKLTWGSIASLAAGSVVEIAFRANLSGVGGDFAQNKATVDTNETIAVSTAHVTQFQTITDIVQSKSVDLGSVDPGDTVTYTIDVRNDGTATASGLSIVDSLPTGFSYVPGSSVVTLPTGATSTANPTVAGQNLNFPSTGSYSLAAGQSTRVVFRADVSPAAIPGSYDNAFTTTYSDPALGPITDSFVGATVDVGTAAEIVQSKSVDRSSAAPGDTVTYTIRVRNDGDGIASDVVIDDVLPRNFNYVASSSTVTLPGGGVSSADPGIAARQLTYPATGSFTLAPSESLEIVFQALISPSTPMPVWRANSISTSWTEPVLPPQSALFTGADVLVALVSDLSLTKTVSNATPNPLDPVGYTITVTNDGPEPATGVQVSDVLPAGITFSNYSATSGTYDEITGLWTVGAITSGTSQTLVINGMVTGRGSITNVAQVAASNETDIDSAPGNSSTTEDDQDAATLVVAGTLTCWAVADNGSPHTSGGDVLTLWNGSSETVVGETAVTNGSGFGTGTDAIEAIAVNPLTGVLYATNDGTLGTLNTTTGRFTAIGSTGFADVDGLAFDPFTGVLYGAVRAAGNDDLIQINLATGAAIPGAFYGADFVDIGTTAVVGLGDIDDLAISPVDGQLYGIANASGGGDRIVKINKSTGTVIDVGSTAPASDVEGLTFNAAGELFGTTGTSAQFYNFSLTTGAGRAPVTLTYGDYEAVDCEINGLNTMSGTVYLDKNADGALNRSDVGTAGVSVSLYRDADGSGTYTAGDSVLGRTTTDAGGAYSFVFPSTGAYLTRVDLNTLPAYGELTTDNVESADFGTGYGLNDLGNNFGYTVPGTLSVAKTSDAPTDLEPGDTITYTVEVTNTGLVNQTNVTLDDAAPTGTTYVPESTSINYVETTAAASFNDNFETDNFAGGSANWATNWLEIGETDGASSGDIQTLNNNGDVALRVRDDDSGSGEGVMRQLNLSGYATAGLTFEALPFGLNGTERVTIDISTNGTTWTNLVTLNGATSTAGYGSYYADITSFISPTTRIRFLTSPGIGGNDGAFFDNVEILAESTSVVTRTNVPASSNPLTNGIAPDLVVPADAVDLAPGATFTATFQVTVDNPSDETLISNTALAASDQSGGTTGSVADPLTRATIADFVWEDLDADGVQDVGEPGLANVTIELLDSSGAVIATTISDGNGVYAFDGLGSGDYTVRFVAPTGFAFTLQDQLANDLADSDASQIDGETGTISVATGETITHVDGGFYQPAVIGDYVWIDLDRDGQQEAGEPGLASVTVNLVDILGAIVATTTTADGSGLLALGEYRFANVTPGDYRVEFVAPGFDFTAQDLGVDTADSDADVAGLTAQFAVSSGETKLDIDAGLLPASVGDFVWVDSNGDGQQDGGEPGLAGVVVNLLDSLGSLIASTVTATGTGPDPIGFYSFDVAPGSYQIQFVEPSGFLFTSPDQGSDLSDSDADAVGLTGLFVIADGSSSSTFDAGLYAPATIGDFVYQDLNGDGSSTGDSGLAGVTVRLLDTLGNELATDVSDSAGAYAFTGLAPGTYVVDVVQSTAPAGYVFTTSNDNGSVSLASGDSDATFDFGFQPTGELTITKSPNTQNVVSNGIATFTIAVENSGASALTNVAVVDALAPDCDSSIGNMAAGAVVSYTCTLTNVTAGFTNTANVAGTGPGGIWVIDEDTADVVLLVPSITISKTTSTPQLLGGGTASFSIVVENTGATDLSGVTVADGLAPDCDLVIGDLAEGASSTHTCELTGVTSDFTNSATVTGTDPIGGTVTATDTAAVDVIAPGIGITKSADQSVVSGGTASFTILVTNTGDADLTGVAIGDALTPDCDATIGSLAVGASTSYTCELTNVTADFTNSATATGLDPLGGTVSATDTADVTVLVPGVSITKSAGPQIYAGGTATFTIVVTNSGDTALTAVAVSDALAPDCDATLPGLAIGASSSHTCELTNVTADFTNSATVNALDSVGGSVSATDTALVDVIAPSIVITKSPDQDVVFGGTASFTILVENKGDVDLTGVAVTDGLSPDCDNTIGALAAGASTTYTCELTNVTAGFTNSATVTGTDLIGGTVTSTDTAVVTVLTPGLSITKTGDQQIYSGGTATFSILVENTGATDLTAVSVVDALTSDCDTTIGALAVGASSTYTCEQLNVTADFTNSATVTGTDPIGGAVSATDTAVVDVIAPSIVITKSPDQDVVFGGTATFTILVENNGDVDLSGVAVSDGLAPDCDNTIGALAAGTSTTYTCELTGVLVGFTNSATVSGTDPIGGTVDSTDTAVVTVLAPGLSITKTGDQQIYSGGTASFTILVENTGATDLTAVSVVDASTPDCDSTVGDLPAGASSTYSCEQLNVTADFTNSATVTGVDPIGGSVSATDSAVVDVIAPSISITKSPDQDVPVGGTASFTILVENNGDVDLTGVAVADGLTPDCDATIGVLASGTSTTYTCELTGVTADFTNSATVIGTDPIGGTVESTDTAVVTVLVPSIDIQKTSDSQQVLSGGAANFTIEVTNTGQSLITNVVVADALAPNCDAALGSLAAGTTTSYTCSLFPVSADFTNTAVVTGDDPLGNELTDSDTADVDVIAPSIAITKSADQQILASESALFSILIENDGDVDLSGVSVADGLTPDCDNIIGDLAVGASITYSCELANVTADFTNSATVSATTPLGGSVTATDSAVVDVVAPSITLSKTPDNQTVVSGNSADFTITVTNDGDVDLTAVSLVDALAPDCDATIGDLVAGGFAVVTCSLDNVVSGFTNTASASGTSSVGTVSATDDAVVTVVVPGIDIQKTPDIQQLSRGDAATFVITVSNSGATPLSGVSVVDALAPDCDATIGDLAVGESTSYSCTLSNVTADFTNTAEVSSLDPAGGLVSDVDTAAIDVVAPSISISKTPDTQAVVSGGTADFTISVTNSGDVDLAGVSVADPLAPNCDATIGALAIGVSVDVVCTLDNVTADFINTASVSGTSAAGPVSASDDAAVTVLVPGITIAKSPDLQSLVSGQGAVFNITVTNSGATPLTGVSVVDAQSPDCDATIGDLAVGESSTYPCSLANVTSSFTNSASASGLDPLGGVVADTNTADVEVIDPSIVLVKSPALQTVVSGDTANFSIEVRNDGDVDLVDVSIADPLAPGCDITITSLLIGQSETVTCSITNVTADLTNTASVTARDSVGNIASSDDSADVAVVSPGISISKTPDLQQLLSGESATFTITVSNTGDQVITSATISDPLSPDCGDTITNLAVGGSSTYTCTLANVGADFTNVASVVGIDALGNSVADADDAEVDVIAPSITISKSPDVQTLVWGGSADFTVVVTNNGDVDLANIVILDPNASDCAASIPVLAPGVSTTTTCTIPNVTAGFTNTATVSADTPVGGRVSATDDAIVTVLIPAVDIQKTPDLQLASVGDTVTFTITVLNAGATDLTNVRVADPIAPDCDAMIGDLAIGESSAYTCELSNVSADFINTAAVSATDPVGDVVLDSDTAEVDVIAPAVAISKTPDNQAIALNGTASFSIEVSNIGDTILTDLIVSDPLAPDCDATITSLAIGGSTALTCTLTNVTADFTNTASVIATDPTGATVEAADQADVVVLVPSISVTKSPATQQVPSGGTATFTITAFNDGSVDLVNVSVDDPLAPACNTALVSLAVGASASYTCTMSVGTSDFTNTVNVQASDSAGNVVSDSAVAAISVVSVGGLTGVVFLDANGDGLFDPTAPANELGIDLVTVSLFDNSGTLVASQETSSGGVYTFSGVPVGDYAVVIDGGDTDIPAEHVLSTNNESQSISVVAATVVDATDVGYTPDASIAGVAFVDSNGDGLDEGVSLANVTVTVRNGSGAVVGSTVAGADGSWAIVGLLPGGYTVEFGAPAGFLPTGRDLNSNDVLDSDFDPATGLTSTISVVAGANVIDIDGGFYLPVTLGDTVFLDLDGNGVQDGFDPGLPGVGVTITWAGPDGTLATADDVITTVTTDANGIYTTGSLAPGSYGIEIDEPAGTTITTGNHPATIALSSGETNFDLDFGLRASGSLAGTVMHDENSNGIFDGSEDGVAGVSILITWSGLDGVLGTGDDAIIPVTSASDGTWSIEGLPVGDYSVTIDVAAAPQGLNAVTFDHDLVADGSFLVSLGLGESLMGLDVGLVNGGAIGDSVFSDVNRNGVQDGIGGPGGEPGLGGVTVIVTGHGPDGILGTADDVVRTIVVDGDGAWTMNGLPAGVYTVTVDRSTIPPGFRGNPSVTITIAAGEVNLSADLPLYPNSPATITDDLNVAVFVGGTPPPVILTDPNGDDSTIVVRSGSVPGITLNPDGTWSGTATAPGVYVLEVDVCDSFGACTSHRLTVRVVARTGTTTVDSSPLAYTGAATWMLLLVGFALTMSGSLLLGLRRRRS